MSSHASANSSLRQYGRPFQNHVHESQISSLPNQRQHCRSSSGKRRTYPQSVSYLYERTHVSFALKEQPLPFGCPNDLPEQSAQHMNQSHLPSFLFAILQIRHRSHGTLNRTLGALFAIAHGQSVKVRALDEQLLLRRQNPMLHKRSRLLSAHYLLMSHERTYLTYLHNDGVNQEIAQLAHTRVQKQSPHLR